jgi:hypothetical protein
MLLLIASMALVGPVPGAFPERAPGLIEACLHNAIEIGEVSDADDSHKYMCTGEAAERFWNFLGRSKIRTYEQDTGEEGVWLSRDFPLGGCFKRVRLADGARTVTGLSCSVWIPRPTPDD